MFDCARTRNGTIFGVWLILLLVFPAFANGEESPAMTREKNAEFHRPNDTDSGLTMSDVMTWVQRFGNRVGDNLSEATSKTVSAVKSAASNNTQDPPLKNSP